MSAHRPPVDEDTIPPRHRNALRKAMKEGLSVELSKGITIRPPRGNRATWRVTQHVNGLPRELSAGSTMGSIYAAFQQMLTIRESIPVLTGNGPSKGHARLQMVIDAYIKGGGKGGRWKTGTKTQQTRAFAKLRELFGSKRCSEINDAMLREALCASAGTHSTGETRRGLFATFLAWGYVNGYFTQLQSTTMERVAWSAPEGSEYQRADSRTTQVKKNFPAPDSVQGGNVMTHEELTDFANECGKRYTHGRLLMHASGNLGTRSSETRLFTADKNVMLQGKGNYVDLDAFEVRIRFQVDAQAEEGAGLPKGTKLRDVVIPEDEQIKSGYALRDELAARARQALEEQARGENPLALYFPTGKGAVWEENNLRNKVWGPAADALGWKMPASTTASGHKRSLRRFTLHSARDRFATTAINEWKYTESMVLEQGAWDDPETVRRHYAGISNATHSEVRAAHGLD